MRTINNYLDAAKARAGIKSDRQLSFVLGYSSGAPICKQRKEHEWPSPEVMLRLAGLAGIDPEIALQELNVWRSAEPARAVYARTLRRIARGAAALAFICPLLGANAGELTANRSTALVPIYTLCALRRLLTRLGNLSLIRPAQA